MLLAKIQNDEVLEIADHRLLFPDVSFNNNGIEPEFLQENNCLPVETYRSYNRETQKLEPCSAYIDEGKVYTVRVLDFTEDDLLQKQMETAANVRKQRDQLLKDSDWTQLTDAPIDKTIWVTYRQDLRDITLQEGFPFDIVWPEIPTN